LLALRRCYEHYRDEEPSLTTFTKLPGFTDGSIYKHESSDVTEADEDEDERTFPDSDEELPGFELVFHGLCGQY